MTAVRQCSALSKGNIITMSVKKNIKSNSKEIKGEDGINTAKNRAIRVVG